MSEAELPRLMSQAEFARHCGVTAGRVSQWKSPAENILRDDAFTKPGRKGKLIVEVALDQVRRNRDIGQALGNGIKTRTEGAGMAAPAPAAPEQPKPPAVPDAAASDPVKPDPSLPVDRLAGGDGQLALGVDQPASAPAEKVPGDVPRVATVQDQLAEERLKAQRLTNRRLQEEEAARRGALVPADEARTQMAQIAGRMMRIFDGALPDFAAAMAEEFGVPQRDALHTLRATFAKVRETVAMKERAEADGAARTRSAEIDMGE